MGRIRSGAQNHCFVFVFPIMGVSPMGCVFYLGIVFTLGTLLLIGFAALLSGENRVLCQSGAIKRATRTTQTCVSRL